MSDNLIVQYVHLYPRENATPHKTDKFELVHDEENPIPLLRRGLKFTIAIRFAERGFQEDVDQLRLIFNYGPNPNGIKGTRGVIKIDPTKTKIGKEPNLWSGIILNNSDEVITLELFAPVNIPIGIWTLQVESTTQNVSTIFDHNNILYFLFNPWNCHDLVFMPEARLLDEYILTDVGKIWIGPIGTSEGREWVFGQFDAVVLPAIMLMFEKSELPPASRGDPIKVTRMISKLVNSNDDDGILVGRWDGDYEDGTAPTSWTGSVPILEEFLDTETSVKYGQCWVFAGVVTAICRALGIPSRVVSNLVSAHDANGTLSVDKYYDGNNEELKYDPNNPLGSDSVWNYHVWNDVWMARPDLPHGYGGWQAIDATPQEASSGFFQCGPASLEAIKKGQVGFNYDVPFMVATVNADLMRWKEDASCDLGYSKIFCSKYHIGRMILTKKPFAYDPNGDKDREEITNQYKSKEGSEAERLALFNAVRGTEAAKQFYSMASSKMEDIEFDLVDLDRINIGENFCLVVKIKNNSEEDRHIKASLSIASVYYNGIKAHLIKKSEGEFKVKANSSEQIRLTIKADDYLDKLVEYCILKLYAIANVIETKQTWAEEDDFQVIKPTIKIQTPSEIPIKKPTRITLSFANPLKKQLTSCKFNISGPSLLRNQMLLVEDAEPGALIQVQTRIAPKLEGEQTLVATFTSKELLGVTGSAKVQVFDDEE